MDCASAPIQRSTLSLNIAQRGRRKNSSSIPMSGGHALDETTTAARSVARAAHSAAGTRDMAWESPQNITLGPDGGPTAQSLPPGKLTRSGLHAAYSRDGRRVSFV